MNFSLISFHIVLCGFFDVPIFLFDWLLIWALRTHMSYLSAAVACLIFAALRHPFFGSFTCCLIWSVFIFILSGFVRLLFFYSNFPCYQMCDCSEYLLQWCMSWGTASSALRTATQVHSINNHIWLGCYYGSTSRPSTF
jgi:hypothetical protein